MAAEKEEQTISAEIAIKREMECRRRVQSILQSKKEKADLLPFQSLYPRKNAEAPLTHCHTVSLGTQLRRKMAAEKEEKAMLVKIAVLREMEYKKRVESIFNPKRETADLLPSQSSYPRKNDQEAFGDRKLKKQVLERGERSTPNHTRRSFPAPQKNQEEPIPHSRSVMSLPEPNIKPYSASTSCRTCAADKLRVSANSNPKPSLSDDTALTAQNHQS